MQGQKAEDDSWQMKLLLHMSPCLQSLEIALHEASNSTPGIQLKQDVSVTGAYDTSSTH
jgi:hypothetical protein